MIDTIILQIPRGQYEIFEHEKFIPPTTRMLNNKLAYFKYVNNPMAKDKRMKIYKPRLTIHKRGRSYDLSIEFSAPKVKYNNNLDELEEKDLDELVRKLQDKIFTMGVKIGLKQLKFARVQAFHPSKNIMLSDGYTSIFAIRELSKIDISKKLDLSKIKFKNNGEQLHFYTNSHSFVFYDKMNDLRIPECRAIDKQQTSYQRSLFEYLKEKNQHEILRFEVRLSKKRKMNEVLQKIGHPTDPTLYQVFKNQTCKKIVNFYWEEYFSDYKFLFSTKNGPQEILYLAHKRYPRIKIKNLIYLVGLNTLSKNKEGIRGLRSIVEIIKPGINWSKLKEDIDKFQDYISEVSLHGFIHDIENSLKNFTAFKIKN